MTPDALKDIRQRLDWTQQRLATALGVSLRAVKYYEAGQRAIPGPVSALATIFLNDQKVD